MYSWETKSRYQKLQICTLILKLRILRFIGIRNTNMGIYIILLALEDLKVNFRKISIFVPWPWNFVFQGSRTRIWWKYIDMNVIGVYKSIFWKFWTGLLWTFIDSRNTKMIVKIDMNFCLKSLYNKIQGT